jgi:hypothetical protein
MAGPAEILIVVGVFSLIGIYLYIASRFLREPSGPAPKQAPDSRTETAPRAKRQNAHAH